MLTPTSRLLELLEMLQAQPLTTGREIAQRLGIDARTVRRYIAALQALDIPVEGQRGVGGGYRMRPGYRLPPLMLNDDEAVAVVLGLIGARGSALDRDDEPVDGALAKILRVLPAPLRTPGRGARADARFTAAPPAARPSAAAWRCCSPTRSGAAGASAPPIARSRASAPRAISARTDSSCTRGAGTSPPTTTAATTCARSASIA